MFVCAFIMCIGAGFAYYRIYVSIMEQNKEIGSTMFARTGTKSTEDQLIALKKKLGDTAREREQMAAYVIPNNKVVDFIQRIETFSTSIGTDVEISTLTEDTPKGKDTLPEPFELLNLQFIASGDWDKLLKLLVFLESMPVAVHVEQAQFNKVGKEFAKTGTWSGFFSVLALKEK